MFDKDIITFKTNPPVSQKDLSKEFDNIFYLFQNNLFNKESRFNDKELENKDKIIQKIINDNSSSFNKQRLLSEFLSYGPLDFLLNQSDVSEIIVNGQDDIFYEQKSCIFKLEDKFLSKITFHNILEKIGTRAGFTVNFKKPFAEGTWGPFRANIVRPPIVKDDFHLCLRRQIQSLWTFEKLEQLHWASSEAIDHLRQFIEDKYNFLIVGSTSSGKTSVLNACLQELPCNERVISIEDTDEISLPNQVSSKLLTQSDPENLKAIIDQQCLVKQSLRLRPDRIVMGEVRGEEAKDLLLALSTGHQGSIGTIHGNNHKQAIWKLEILAQMGETQWSSSVIRNLIFSSLDALVVLEKKEDLRLLKGLYKITSLEPPGFLFETVFET